MKTRQKLWVFGIALSAITGPLGVIAAEPALSALDEKIEIANASVSSYAAEVVKLNRAGIDAGVVQSFVENSNNSVPLRSDEIIYLHNKGIPANVIAAMIKRSAKMNELPQVPAPAPAPVASVSYPATAPAVVNPVVLTVSAPAPQPTYVPAPTVIYQQSPSYVYSYPAPYYYSSYPSYGYCYTGRPYYYGGIRAYGGYSYFGNSGNYYGGTRFNSVSVGFSSHGHGHRR